MENTANQVPPVVNPVLTPDAEKSSVQEVKSSGHTPLLLFGVVVILLILAAGGYYLYSTHKAPATITQTTQNPTTNQAMAPKVSPTSTIVNPTLDPKKADTSNTQLDQDTANIDTSLSSLGSDITSVDQSVAAQTNDAAPTQ